MKTAVRTGITPCPLIATIIEQDGRLRARGVTTAVAWVKGHAKSIGNNVADRLAARGSLAAFEGAPAGTRFENPIKSGLVQGKAIAFQDVIAGTSYDDPDKVRAAAWLRSGATRRKMEDKRRLREERQKRQQTEHRNEQQGVRRSQRLAALEHETAGSRLHPISLE